MLVRPFCLPISNARLLCAAAAADAADECGGYKAIKTILCVCVACFCHMIAIDIDTTIAHDM